MLNAHVTATRAPSPALLPPELSALADAGVLSRAAARDAGERGRVELPRRDGLTRAQAGALAALLGVAAPRPANDRA
jgi:hypothetical protein